MNYPNSFDSRTRWPSCVHGIRDQGQCGSWWAFALTESVSDRFWINGLDLVLAPQDPVSCDDDDYGWNGGYLDKSFNYLVKTGIVKETCFPYESGNGRTPPWT